MTNQKVQTLLATVRDLRDVWQLGRTNSLLEFTKPTRVEPYVLIDAQAMYFDGLPEVQQSILNQFSGLYLQAVALLTQVNNVSVMKQLEKLNPNRDVGEAALNSSWWTLIKESYADRLPHATGTLALEAEQTAEQKANERKVADPHFNPSKDAVASVKDLANLSVGKLLSVEVTDGNQKVTIPVNVRLLARTIATHQLIHILTGGAGDATSASDRYHGLRAGRLELIRDIIFANDLVKAHRKRLKEDPDDIYANMVSKARQNKIAAILSGEPSLAAASNIIVTTKASVVELELALNGRLSDFRVREKMLEPTTIMLIAVCDPSQDRVTFYYRGIPEPTDLGMRDLKIANKGNGPDVNDILRAFQAGAAPRM